MPFHQPQQLQCLHHGATFEPLCAPILSSQLFIGDDDLWLAHNGFRVRHKYCCNTSHSYNVMEWVQHSWYLRCYGFHASKYGACASQVNLPYFPLWLDGLERCLSCCSMLILLCNGQNIAEYEVYWLMGVPIINHLRHAYHSLFWMLHHLWKYHGYEPIIIMFSKK